MADSQQQNYSEISIKNKYSTTILPIVLAAGDYFAILLAAFFSEALRNCLISSTYFRLSWLSFHVIIPFVYIVFMQISGLYTRRMQFWRVISKIFNVNVYAVVSLVFLMYLNQVAASTSRLFVIFMAISSFFLLVAMRYIMKKIFLYTHMLQIPVLVMGAGKTASLILDYLKTDAGLGYDFIGYLEDNKAEQKVISMMPHLGKFSDAETVIKATGVQQIMVIAPGLNNEGIQNIVYRLQPLVRRISFIPDMGTMPLATMDMESLIDGHIVTFTIRNNLDHWYNRLIKRAVDLALTSIGIICLLPVFLLISIWIYKDSPGPVVFKHYRVGRNGKKFPCYKFRSMCVDADVKLKELLEKDAEAKAEWEKEFKLKNDPRITSSGAFLRRTSLDELPQLFNVLKGEMSLVGPRPIIDAEISRYGKYIEDFYMVRPGITGMWQTSGRSDVSYDERVQMDTWYVRNWNIWFDIVLIWRTITVVLGKKGAY